MNNLKGIVTQQKMQLHKVNERIEFLSKALLRKYRNEDNTRKSLLNVIAITGDFDKRIQQLESEVFFLYYLK